MRDSGESLSHAFVNICFEEEKRMDIEFQNARNIVENYVVLR